MPTDVMSFWRAVSLFLLLVIKNISVGLWIWKLYGYLPNASKHCCYDCFTRSWLNVEGPLTSQCWLVPLLTFSWHPALLFS